MPDRPDDELEPSDEVVSPRDFGGMLRQARERHGISLRHIAVTTKIAITALEALERNDVSRLPGGIFSRAFVRSYASEVGLDPERTVQEFIERFPTQDAGHSTRHTREFREEEDFDSQRAVVTTAAKLVGVSLPVAALILYFTLSGGSATSPAEEPAPATAAESQTTGGPTPAAAGQAPGPVVPAVAPSADAATAAVTAEGLRVEIRATGPCWVSVVTDGSQSFARVLDVGDEAVEQVRDEIVIQVGDAGSFVYAINGVTGRPLGVSGEVVTARINSSNYQTFLAR